MTTQLSSKPMQVFVASESLGQRGPFGYGIVVIDNFGKRAELSGGGKSATKKRAELKAAFAGIDDCMPGTSITLYTESEYVAHGINEGMANWEESRWKNGTIPNLDLWAKIWHQRRVKTVQAVLVGIDARTPLMAYCGDLAREQALSYAKKVNS